MSNRILKDSIWDSPTLAILPEFIQDQFPRWLLLSDDWGCFCAETDSIKGTVYPKRPKVTPKVVEEIRLALYESGLLFCWQERDRVWAFWTNFGEHNYLTSLDESGSRIKNRRRTPEPPAELLDAYMLKYKTAKKEHRAAPWDNLGQDGTPRNKTANSPFPIPQLDSHSQLEVDNTGVVVAAVICVTPDEMIEIWDRERGGMPACRVFSEKRRAKCRTRIAERSSNPESFRYDFLESVRKASQIPFFVGAGDRGWKGDFDWFIENDTNYLKVLEGKYDGKKKEPESREQAKVRRNFEAAGIPIESVFGNAGDGFGSGDHEPAHRALSATAGGSDRPAD